MLEIAKEKTEKQLYKPNQNKNNFVKKELNSLLIPNVYTGYTLSPNVSFQNHVLLVPIEIFKGVRYWSPNGAI